MIIHWDFRNVVYFFNLTLLHDFWLSILFKNITREFRMEFRKLQKRPNFQVQPLSYKIYHAENPTTQNEVPTRMNSVSTHERNPRTVTRVRKEWSGPRHPAQHSGQTVPNPRELIFGGETSENHLWRYRWRDISYTRVCGRYCESSELKNNIIIIINFYLFILNYNKRHAN
jgi:hypothetical protein